jgi:hypothetical protein
MKHPEFHLHLFQKEIDFQKALQIRVVMAAATKQ